ncbi:MAG: hypothetical protein GQ558_00390 [Thermoplasmata archaeon]|nr:hypothetical protein [Thermoplasmata archaeon]
MGAMGDFASRVRGYFSSAGRGLGRAVGRSTRDVVTTIEDRPDIGPIEVDLPYPLPTREDPLAYLLFFVAGITLVVTVIMVVGFYLALGEVPSEMALVVGVTALALGVVGNLRVIAGYLEDHGTQLLRPLVGAGIPLLSALHYWFNPVVAILALIYVLIHPSNNWLMHTMALILLAWMVTGLLLKLPRRSPWNGPMLKRTTGTIHKRPFVYIMVLAMVFVSVLADYVK